MLLTHPHLPSLLIYRHTVGLQQQGIRGVGRWLDEADIMLSRLIELEGRWDVGAEIGFRNFLKNSAVRDLNSDLLDRPRRDHAFIRLHRRTGHLPFKYVIWSYEQHTSCKGAGEILTLRLISIRPNTILYSASLFVAR